MGRQRVVFLEVPRVLELPEEDLLRFFGRIQERLRGLEARIVSSDSRLVALATAAHDLLAEWDSCSLSRKVLQVRLERLRAELARAGAIQALKVTPDPADTAGRKGVSK